MIEYVENGDLALIDGLKLGTVLSAVKNLLRINTQPKSFVQGNVQVNTVGVKSVKFCGYEDVYNMEVEDNHNYLANGGIVIHNCMDATRYFVNTMNLTKKKRTYGGE